MFKDLQPLVKRYISLYDIYNTMEFQDYSFFNYKTKSSFEKDYNGLFEDREFEGALAARELPLSISLLQTRELIETARDIVRLIDEDLKDSK